MNTFISCLDKRNGCSKSILLNLRCVKKIIENIGEPDIVVDFYDNEYTVEMPLGIPSCLAEENLSYKSCIVNIKRKEDVEKLYSEYGY